MHSKSYSTFSFFPHLFQCSPFFYHYVVLIRRSPLDNWIRMHLFFFSLNQCHSFAFALEKLCEAQNLMMIMKIFLMFICDCTYHQHYCICHQVQHSLCHTKRRMSLCVLSEVTNGALLIRFTHERQRCVLRVQFIVCI